MTADSCSDHVLTERRKAILVFHEDYVERCGYAPSYREIGEAVGLKSLSSVAHQVKSLEEMGALARTARRPRTTVTRRPHERGIQAGPSQPPVTAGSAATATVPLFDRIAAGPPVIANREPEDIMQLPRDQVGSGDLFAVKVAGDSMINASIFDGDIVVVREQNDAHNGDIVAALIEEEATVKTFQRMNGHIWLLPQNPTHDPIPGDNCRIMGKVVATIHRL
jgi:repressor LexA